MENHFNTPAEVVDLSIKACENKTKLPVGKMILLGIMAGVFIALGGATSSTAAHAVENVGVARALAGVIFPVGLMLIVFFLKSISSQVRLASSPERIPVPRNTVKTGSSSR